MCWRATEIQQQTKYNEIAEEEKETVESIYSAHTTGRTTGRSRRKSGRRLGRLRGKLKGTWPRMQQEVLLIP